MKKIINKLTTLLLVVLALACTDESLDPVKFTEVGKATYLALRGGALDNLNNSGCSNSFYKNNPAGLIGTETFSFDGDFLSEDQEALSEVQVFAQVNSATAPIARKQVGTVAGSVFTFPSGAATKQGKVTVTLAAVMSGLGLTPTSLAAIGVQDLVITCDLLLTDGSKIFASAIINGSLFESVIFNPAMNLVYCANDVADFVPIASPSLLGKYGTDTNDDDELIVKRTKIPSLKSGAKDTLYIKFDNDIIDPPTVTFDPDNMMTGGSNTALVSAKEVDEEGFYTSDTDPSAFYLIYTAGSNTGIVTATISGATANVDGVVLTQDAKTQAINVDNTDPVRISTSTGTRVGVGQFVTMKVTFNEKLSTKSDDAILVTVDGSARGLETVTDAAMAVASDGLSASLVYSFKLATPTTVATHGGMTVVFTKAFDEAGNDTSIPNATLLVDVDAPPAPSLTASSGYDLGTQIRWSATAFGAPSNGSRTGSVYFVAVTTGDAAPTAFSVDLDGVATWTMGALAVNKQEGIVEVEGGSSGAVFTQFDANGDLDVYSVFVSNSGTISNLDFLITSPTYNGALPGVAPGSGNPLTITMN